jgi:outer membrane lipoprotein-sorting protein
MKFKKSITFVALMLMASTLFFAQESALEQFEQELKKENTELSTIKCLFTQSRMVSVLADEVNKKGQFYFQIPGNMLLSFDDGDYIKMTPSRFEIKNAGKVNTTKVDSNPMLRNLSSILSACVVGDFSQISKGFTVKAESISGEWVVEMIPRRGKSASKVSKILVHFDKKDMSLNLLRMEEESGDYTEYKFYNKQFNTEIESTLFADVSE